MRRPNSSFAATTISAAADGVGARRSATKSAMVTSVSWPTAEMTGTGDAAIARATISSLNARRSSSEPAAASRDHDLHARDLDDRAQRLRQVGRRAVPLDARRTDHEMRVRMRGAAGP